MANSRSARKRIKINERNRLINRFYKSSVQTLIKKFFQKLEIYKASKTSEDQKTVQEALNSIYSLIDKGTKKKVFHKNTAAKKKARLAASLKIV